MPLLARGRSLGFAVFSRKRGRPPFSAADAVLAAELAARAATCVDNACLYRREHRTATALKAGLLPSRVTAPPGLEIAHRYLPARSGVGGDWYDVVPLSGDRIAVVIGDSVGHGVTAAAAMGQLRVAAHTLASCEFPPGEVLERLDAIAQDLDAAQFATCLCLVCDPVTLRCEVARAGHPPPLLAMPDGSARHFAVPNGLPLGVSDPEHPPAYGQVPAVLRRAPPSPCTPTAWWRAGCATSTRASPASRPPWSPRTTAPWRRPPTACWPCWRTSRATTTSRSC